MAYLNGQKVFLLNKIASNHKISKMISGVNFELTADDFEKCQNIRQYAFYMCNNLNSVELPNTLTTIGDYAFSNCNSFRSVVIPSGVTSIGNYAFNNTGLQSVIIQDGANIGDSKSNQFSLNSLLYYVTLGSGITKISTRMFYSCTLLPEIDIPANVAIIGISSFYNCSRLTKVILRGTTLKTLSDSGAFGDTPIASGTGYIYVDDTLVDSYKSATNWSTYASVIKGISELED